MTHVGGRIRTLRTERQMTLPALADKSGLSKGLLSRLENQEDSNPSLETLHKAAGALGVTLSELLESGRVQAKRILPDKEPGWLAYVTKALADEGKKPDEDLLQALYVLQNRKGASQKTDTDWFIAYKNLELSFGKTGA